MPSRKVLIAASFATIALFTLVIAQSALPVRASVGPIVEQTIG